MSRPPTRRHRHDRNPAGLLPERPAPHSEVGPAMREYNAYLSELARTDAELAKTDESNSDAVRRRTGRLHDRTPRRPARRPRRVRRRKVRTALTQYRVLAWATGIWLIALCYEMLMKYVVKVDDPPTWIGIVHGWVYFAYLMHREPRGQGALAHRQDHRVSSPVPFRCSASSWSISRPEIRERYGV